MPAIVKQRRTRVTRKDIESARRELLEQPNPIRAKADVEAPRYRKDSWYGLVYCDSNGWASIVGDKLEGVWLGKTSEFIPYLRRNGIDGENAAEVLRAYGQFHSLSSTPRQQRSRFHGTDGYLPLPPYQPIKAEVGRPRKSESHSCHLATENQRGHISIHPPESIVAILRKDPHFSASLDALIAEGLGIRMIHSELGGKGYRVPMRTLGRWIKQRRDNRY